jgi:hydroxyacylglutathione hydrolase
LETGSTIAVDVPGLAEQIRSGEVRVLDVRDEDEWEESHVPGSIHIPFHELRNGVPAELENGGKPLAIVCSAGNRSSIAASLLKRAGLDGVEHVADGGVEDLRNEGIELVEGE